MKHAIASVVVAVFAACAAPTAPPDSMGDDDSDGVLSPDGDPPVDSPHLALGTPSDTTPLDDYLIVHEQFAAGYSQFLNASNWVSWRTRADDFGPVDRYEGPFYSDTTLPPTWFHPEGFDMNGSGYDRGHMLRSEERTSTTDVNIATFVMTNVLPQRADLNRGPWFDFELYVQHQVESSTRPRDAYVIAGAVWSIECATHAQRVAGDGCIDVGRSSDVTHHIAVPTATWKVVLFVTAGTPPLEGHDAYIVGVLMPNERGINEARWWKYRATVAEIEAASGYDLPSLE